MKKKNIEEIESPSAKKAILGGHEKFGKTISVNGCFGSSDLGQMTGFLAREIRNKIPNAFMRCPLAFYPEVEGPSQVLLHDDYNITIDGCSDRCLAKTLEKAGMTVHLSYALDEDFGLEKHPQPAEFAQETMLKVSEKIIRDIQELMEKEKQKSEA